MNVSIIVRDFAICYIIDDSRFTFLVVLNGQMNEKHKIQIEFIKIGLLTGSDRVRYGPGDSVCDVS